MASPRVEKIPSYHYLALCIYQLIEGSDRFDTKMAHWRENETKVYLILALECLHGFRTPYLRNPWTNGHFIRVDA